MSLVDTRPSFPLPLSLVSLGLLFFDPLAAIYFEVALRTEAEREEGLPL